MKKKRFVYCFAAIVFLVLSGFSTLCHAEGVKVLVWPKISYNQMNGLRLGANLKLSHLLGTEDSLKIYGDYSLGDKTVHCGYAYKYIYNTTQFYTAGDADLLNKGVYDGTTLWQYEEYLNLGVSKATSVHGILNWFDVQLKYNMFQPDERFELVPFDGGKDLTIASQAFGYNKGWTWKENLTWGIRTRFSYFNYIKEQMLVKRAIDLSSKDRITLAGQLGFIRGAYPTLQQFYLGSSDYNILPNLAQFTRTMGRVVNDQMMLPGVDLNGYIRNAFYGENSYVGKIEYQHKLYTSPNNMAPFDCFGKVYVVTGNAWTGNLVDGFLKSNPAIGLGVNIESPAMNLIKDQHEWYVGFNFAHGMGDKAALTVGLDAGLNFNFLNPIIQNAVTSDY